jgi:hypothetical protein
MTRAANATGAFGVFGALTVVVVAISVSFRLSAIKLIAEIYFN